MKDMEKLQETIVSIEPYFHSDACTVARASEEDIPAVVALINHAFEYQDEAKGEKRIDEAALRKKLATSEFYVWKDDAGNLVATTYVVLEADKAHFGLLAVADELRGKRLASSIITAIEEYARANNKSILELDYMSLSPWLGKYYERYGFVKTGFVEGIGYTELVQMQKKLG